MMRSLTKGNLPSNLRDESPINEIMFVKLPPVCPRVGTQLLMADIIFIT